MMLWKWNFQRLVPKWNSGTRKITFSDLKSALYFLSEMIIATGFPCRVI
jgi:hypothetical protein